MEALARVALVYGYLQQSRVPEAERALAPLLVEFAHEPAVHRAHAALAQRTGRVDVAIAAMQTAAGLAPQDPRLQVELGQVLVSVGRFDQAIATFSRAVELGPDLAGAWLLLGMTLCDLRRDAEALPALQRSHALAPEHRQITLALAETHYLLEHHAEALAMFEQGAVSGGFDDPNLQLRRSQCLRRVGAPQAAHALLREAVGRFPENATLWLELGGLQEDLGDAAAAKEAYARAHALHPRWGDPLGAAIALARASAPEALVREAETLLLEPEIPSQQRAFLHHALGKRDDSRGEHAAAAVHWSSANALRRAQDAGFDRDAFTAQIEAIVAAFRPELLRARHASALRDERPMFVLGMPRSGTTLVEQILASHPWVHGCDERIGIAGIADRIAPETGREWPGDAAGIADDWLRRQATHYLDSAPVAHERTRRLVDKYPYNYLHVGLLAMLFADARIIWCRRDPRDIALSIFSENFSPRTTWATDLDDIRFVIDGQTRLMRHWQSASPLPILEVRYEDVVSDIEAQSRRLVDFAGLPWDDACLSFHASTRPVQTLSRWQVRQPVHGRSIGRWRHYPQWFGGDDGTVTASGT